MKLPKFQLSKKAKLVALPVVAAAILVPGIVIASIHGKDGQDNVNLSSTTQNTDKEAGTKPADIVEVEAQEQQPAPIQQAAQQPAQEESPQAENKFSQGHAHWYVFNRLVELGKTMPAANYNNTYCHNLLVEKGYPSSKEPSLHAMACKGQHVAVVEQINQDGSVWISEMNSRGQVSMTDTTTAGGWNKVSYRLLKPAEVQLFDFVE